MKFPKEGGPFRKIGLYSIKRKGNFAGLLLISVIFLNFHILNTINFLIKGNKEIYEKGITKGFFIDKNRVFSNKDFVIQLTYYDFGKVATRPFKGYIV